MRPIEIDARDLRDKLDMMQAVCRPQRYQRALYRIYNRTGKHVRAVLQADLPKHYEIRPSLVGKAVEAARIQNTGCIIPVRDRRGDIGGRYGAIGGAHGWNSLRGKYKVRARITKAGQSTLPEKMDSYGGMPPFRNLGSKLKKLTFTRAGKARLPIMKVVGIAIPQMPLNRSQDDVQRDIRDWLGKQIEREFMNIMAGR